MSATAAIIAPDAPIRRQVMRDSSCAKSAFVARCLYAPDKRGGGAGIGAVVVAIFLFSESARVGAELAGRASILKTMGVTPLY